MAGNHQRQRLVRGKDYAHRDIATGYGSHRDLATGYGSHRDLARGRRRHPCFGRGHDTHRRRRGGQFPHGSIGGDDGGERHSCVKDVLREFGTFGDDRHAGAVLWPYLPQVGRVLPQGAGGFVGEDGGGRGLALREVAEGDAVAQAFVEDVLLRLGDQPRGHFVVVDRRAE